MKLNQELASNYYKGFVGGMSQHADWQQRILVEIIQTGHRTLFGKRYGYESIGDLETFRQRVPLSTYQDYCTDINRILSGQEDILFRGKPFACLSSSGTTGGAKVIPVGRAHMERAFNPFMMSYLYSAAQRWPNLVTDSDRTINFKWDPLRRTPTLDSGHRHLGLSQLNLREAFSDSAPVEPGTSAPWAKISSDIGCDIQRILTRMVIACGHDVRQLVGINPALLAAVPYILDDFADEFLVALSDGEIQGVRISEPRPELARQVERLFVKRDASKFRALWPNLDRIVCWDEGLASFYLKDVCEQLGHRVEVVPAPLAASESPLAINLPTIGACGVLAYNTAFYEFIDLKRPDIAPKLSCELIEGRCYVVVVTQFSGLARYIVGDVVQVTGHLSGVPLLRYMGRYRPGHPLQDADLLTFMGGCSEVLSLPVNNFRFQCITPSEYALELSCSSEVATLENVEGVMKRHFTNKFESQSLLRCNLVSRKSFYYDWKYRVQEGSRAAQVKDRVVVQA